LRFADFLPLGHVVQMRTHAVRTFAGAYQPGGARKPFSPEPNGEGVASARALVEILGLGFAVAGIAVAWTVSQLVGMGILIVGAFLLILPFTLSHDDE